jgi:hypothetical protein
MVLQSLIGKYSILQESLSNTTRAVNKEETAIISIYCVVKCTKDQALLYIK